MPRCKCDNYQICEKYDSIFGICEASNENDMSLSLSDVQQCSHTEKTKIAILANIDAKLQELLEK